VVGISLVRLTEAKEWKDNTVTFTRTDDLGAFGIGIQVGGNSKAWITGGKSEENHGEGMVVANPSILDRLPIKPPDEDGAQVVVKTLVVSKNGRSGIYIGGGSHVFIEKSSMQDNEDGLSIRGQSAVTVSGGFLMDNRDDGLHLQDAAVAWIRDKVMILKNTYAGLHVESTQSTPLQVAAVEVRGNGTGIYLRGNSLVEIRDSKVVENAYAGASLGDAAHLIALATEFAQNKHGLYAFGNASLFLSGITSQGNTGTGLILFDNTQADVNNSRFVNNKMSGLQVEGGARLVLKNVISQSNTFSGLALFDGSQVEASDTKLTDNKLGGVVAQGSAQLILDNVTSRSNHSAGLELLENARGKARQSQFIGNAWEGLFASGSTQLALDDVTSQDNGYEGLLVLGNAKAEVHNSKFIDNEEGLRAQDNAYISGANSRFESNTLSGLHLDGEAQAFLRDSSIADNGWHGIILFGSAKAELRQNTIKNNEDCGILAIDTSFVIGADNGVLSNHPDLCGRVPASVRKTPPANLDLVRVPQEIATLQEAIDRLKPGGVIKLSAGTFKESVTITKALVLQGPSPQEGSGQAVLDSVGSIGIAVLAEVPQLSLTDITITHTYVEGRWYEAGLDIAGSTDATLIRVSVEKNRHGLIISGEARLQFEDVAIRNNVGHGLWTRGKSRVYLTTSQITANEGCGVRADQEWAEFSNQGSFIENNKPDLCGNAPSQVLNLPEPTFELVRVPQDVATIQEAIYRVRAGGRIEVAPGVYEESLVVTKDLTLVGTGQTADETTLINLGAVGVAILGEVSHMVMERINIRGDFWGEIGIELLGKSQAEFKEIRVAEHFYLGILVSGRAQLVLRKAAIIQND